jgi:hypothetical protein
MTLDRDKYAYLYALVCDVVERNYHGWPLDHGHDDDDEMLCICHTSKQARAAALRIFDILGVECEGAA